MTIWYLFSFFMVALFSQDLRALLIIPRMEEPIDRMSQIDFGETKTAIAFGKVVVRHGQVLNLFYTTRVSNCSTNNPLIPSQTVRT